MAETVDEAPPGLLAVVALPLLLFTLFAVALLVANFTFGPSPALVSGLLALAGAAVLMAVTWRSRGRAAPILVGVAGMVLGVMLALGAVRLVSGWQTILDTRADRATADAVRIADELDFSVHLRDEAAFTKSGWPVAQVGDDQLQVAYADGLVLLQERLEAVRSEEQMRALVAEGRSFVPGSSRAIPASAQASVFLAGGAPAVVVSWSEDGQFLAQAVAQYGTTLVRVYGDDPVRVVEAARGLAPVG